MLGNPEPIVTGSCELPTASALDWRAIPPIPPTFIFLSCIYLLLILSIYLSLSLSVSMCVGHGCVCVCLYCEHVCEVRVWYICVYMSGIHTCKYMHRYRCACTYEEAEILFGSTLF